MNRIQSNNTLDNPWRKIQQKRELIVWVVDETDTKTIAYADDIKSFFKRSDVNDDTVSEQFRSSLSAMMAIWQGYHNSSLPDLCFIKSPKDKAIAAFQKVLQTLTAQRQSEMLLIAFKNEQTEIKTTTSNFLHYSTMNLSLFQMATGSSLFDDFKKEQSELSRLLHISKTETRAKSEPTYAHPYLAKRETGQKKQSRLYEKYQPFEDAT